MKKTFLTCLVGTTLLTAQAQLFSPEAFNGAALGALIGGIAGGDSHSHGCHYYNDLSGNGAAIGAGIGLLAGALLGEARRQSDYDSTGYAYAPAPAPSVNVGYGYGGGGSSSYVYYSPNPYTAPGYYYRPARPNYAVGGTLLGAASGALIGAGNCQAGEGAAIGAGAGLVMGGVAEYTARKQEKKMAKAQTTSQNEVQQTAYVATPQDAAPQAHDMRSEITSKPSPTSTYHWTPPPPQIPDALRVPDAPKF